MSGPQHTFLGDTIQPAAQGVHAAAKLARGSCFPLSAVVSFGFQGPAKEFCTSVGGFNVILFDKNDSLGGFLTSGMRM